MMKAERRRQILKAAAELFADRGFRTVSIDDLGAAAGVSGPAVYRHFSSKEAVLGELLVGVSHRLLEGGTTEVSASDTPTQALSGLVSFHTQFALCEPELIRVQDRDLASLPATEAKLVRRLQRAYAELWVKVLLSTNGMISTATARTKVHATFGLINSTPHIANAREVEGTGRILEQMAMAALTAPIR
jgi:AcrR family transcriptional regulator